MESLFQMSRCGPQPICLGWVVAPTRRWAGLVGLCFHKFCVLVMLVGKGFEVQWEEEMVKSLGLKF